MIKKARVTILFLLLWLIHTAGASNILVLHSYHPSFKWDREINEGIHSVLASRIPHYQVVMEYMDTKRKVDTLYLQRLLELYQHKYADIKFDLIISTDDDALTFLIQFGNQVFPGVPVVFCGVNDYDEQIKHTHPHITGVLEQLDLMGTTQQALQLFPATREIFFVGDRSTTSHDLSEIFKNQYQSLFPDLSFQYLHHSNIDTLTSVLEKLPPNSLIMLWPYLMQQGNLVMNVETATHRITSASNAPVFGFWRFQLDNGIIGGKLLSGFAQGEQAAMLATEILSGVPIDQLPAAFAITNDDYFDYKVLKKYKVPLASLPPGNIIINPPVNFFTSHQGVLKGFLIALVVFTVMMIINALAGRRIRKVLKNELEFQHELLNALPNPVFYTLDNNIIEDCNRSFEKLTGLTKEEIIGKEIPSFYVPAQIKMHREINEELLLTHKPVVHEGQVSLRDDNIRDVLFYKSLIYSKRNRKYGIIETIIDITDKKTASEKIRLSEERYALATRATKDGIWDWNLKGKELFTSVRLKEMLGYHENEVPITHHNFQQHIHPDDIHVFDHQTNLLRQEVKDTFSIDLRMKQKNKNYIWVEMNVFALLDHHHRVYRVVGSVSNIQSRKDSEIKLKKWEDIFNNTRMGIATTLPDAGKAELWNPMFAQLHGYTALELKDKLFDQLIAPEAREEKISIFEKAASQGHYVTELTHIRKDGVQFPVMLDITAVKSSSNTLLYFILNVQDITHRKIQENKISQMLQNEQVMNEELRSGEEEIRQSLLQTVTLKEKLEENQKQFISFINGTSDFAILKDHDLRYVIVNEAFASYYNQSANQLIGKTDDEIAPKELTDDERIMDRQVLEEKKSVIYNREYKGRCYETRKFPVSFENNYIGVGAFIRDITHQRMIENQVLENEKRFKTLLENSFDLITLTDPDGIILYCTDAVSRLTGFTPAQLLGKHFNQFFHPEDRAEFGQKLEKVLADANEPAHIQHRVKHDSSGYRHVETIATNHLENPLIKAIVFTSRDVSMELQSRELKKNIALAQKSAEIKQHFLATMSHEIRTPMNGIVGMIEFLQRTPLNETQEDYVRTIKYSADSLLNIINDILDFSKIEAGKLNITPTAVKVADFFAAAPKIFAALLRQKNLELTLLIDESLPEYLNLDALRVNQVISNLLSNAIKFTPSGSISMRIFPDQVTHDTYYLRVEVQDTGIGISEEEQKTLFKPFIQIESAITRTIEGTGLGLTISQRIVELMGGEIGVISAPAKGSMFWFTLASSIPEEIISSNHPELRPMRELDLNIMLVEDKAVNQKVIRLMLESLGCTVTIASNGKQAIDLIDKHHSQQNIHPAYDIILMDIQMPVMDGITATGIIREKYPEYKIIIGLSANVISSDVEGFLSGGLNDYIVKPATSEELYAKLLYWSEKDKQSNESQEAVFNEESFSEILLQADYDPMVLGELFSAYYKDASELAVQIRQAFINNPEGISEPVQQLHQLALSMGARQTAFICTLLLKAEQDSDEQINNTIALLEKSIRQYSGAAFDRLSQNRMDQTD